MSDATAKETTRDPETLWLEEVYHPGERQLTVRAVLAGMLLGAALALLE